MSQVNEIRKRLIRLLFCVSLAGICQAGDLAIKSFDNAGRLTFSELTTATVYRVEWAPKTSGPWTNSWAALSAIPATGSGIVTCSVPMFYRVVATVTNLQPANPPIFVNNDFEADENGATPPSGWGIYLYTVSDTGVVGVPAYTNHTLQVTTGRRYSGSKAILSSVVNTYGQNYSHPANGTTRRSTQILTNNIPIDTSVSTLYLWRSSPSFTTSSRWSFTFSVILTDGTNTGTVQLFYQAFNSGAVSTHDLQAAGNDGQTWYRHPIPIPANIDRSKLRVAICNCQDSWDGTSASNTIYYDLITDN